jgi:toxin-antitoxin system PIN domain toxin
LAAVFIHHPAHTPAKDVLQTATPQHPACFCRASQQSFLRLITTPALLRIHQAEGFTNREAVEVYNLLRAKFSVVEIAEPPGTAGLWHRLAARDTASPKVWMDAYLAAFAITGKLDFVTLDADFLAYGPHGLRVRLLTPPVGR